MDKTHRTYIEIIYLSFFYIYTHKAQYRVVLYFFEIYYGTQKV